MFFSDVSIEKDVTKVLWNTSGHMINVWMADETDYLFIHNQREKYSNHSNLQTNANRQKLAKISFQKMFTNLGLSASHDSLETSANVPWWIVRTLAFIFEINSKGKTADFHLTSLNSFILAPLTPMMPPAKLWWISRRSSLSKSIPL